MQKIEEQNTLPGVWDYETRRAICPECGRPVSFSGQDCRHQGRSMPLDEKGGRIRYLYCQCGAGFKALPPEKRN